MMASWSRAITRTPAAVTDGPPRRARPLAEALARGGGDTTRRGPGAPAGAAAGARRPGRRARDRAAGVRRVRGLGRFGEGRGDPAPGRAPGPAPRARRPVCGADLRREAPPLALALL